MSFADLPNGASGDFKPFKIAIPKDQVEEMNTLIKLSKIAPQTFENSFIDLKYGVGREWMVKARDEWMNNFSWSKAEDRMNSYPHFTTTIEDDKGTSFTIHFVALFSKKPSAIPITMVHGWPGSFLEFLPTLSLLQSRYTSDTLPYHVIIPSIPGYTFSSGPPVDRDYSLLSVAIVFDKLMRKLGFASGYIAQGGDLGSRVVRNMARQSDACKAVHLNFLIHPLPPRAEDGSELPVTDLDKKEIEKLTEFRSTGSGYSNMHATRPATIGMVLQSSPIALVAWIGEKMLIWTDQDPPLETILEEGGHFAALEKPEILWKDIEEFIAKVWK
ncbi:MAG: hypothetical protein Q9227_008970 [Pyrenula ochraceoflavens]